MVLNDFGYFFIYFLYFLLFFSACADFTALQASSTSFPAVRSNLQVKGNVVIIVGTMLEARFL